VTLGRV
jgi:hypothetical protein